MPVFELTVYNHQNNHIIKHDLELPSDFDPENPGHKHDHLATIENLAAQLVVADLQPETGEFEFDDEDLKALRWAWEIERTDRKLETDTSERAYQAGWKQATGRTGGEAKSAFPLNLKAWYEGFQAGLDTI
jgi:hypothetical protein